MISPDDLTEEQKQLIHTWAAEGVELGEIQSRLSDDHGLKATYMEMHLLMIDLKVEFPDEEEEEPEPETAPEAGPPPGPQDPAQAMPAAAPGAPPAPGAVAEPIPEAAPAAEPPGTAPEPGAPPPGPPGMPNPEDLPDVTVTLSDLTRPGTMAGGQVTFDDGETAEWYMDEFGRLGMNPTNPEFKPSELQIMAFQVELQKIARSRGL